MRKIQPEEVRGWRGVAKKGCLWGWGFHSFLLLGKERLLPFSRASCMHEVILGPRARSLPQARG